MMDRRPKTRLLLSLWMAISSCAMPLDHRTVDGTYLDFNGEVRHTYGRNYETVVNAGIDTLAALDLPVRSKRGGPWETIVLAAAPAGSTLRLRFRSEDGGRTTVGVRTGTTGYRDHEFSFHVHALLKKKLKNAVVAPSDREPGSATRPMAADDSQDVPTNERDPAAGQAATSYSESGSIPNKALAAPASPSMASRPGSAGPSEIPGKFFPARLPKPDYTVYFQKNSNLPGPDQMAKLDQIADRVMANPTWTISLSGYAGRDENESQPGLVSESRVMAVKFYLVGKGVAAGRIADQTQKMPAIGKAVDAHLQQRVDIRLFPGP